MGRLHERRVEYYLSLGASNPLSDVYFGGE